MARLPGPRDPVALARTGWHMLRRPHATLFDLHDRYGPVVQVGVRPQRYVFLFGREANETILSESVDSFRWGEAMAPLAAVDGPTALVVSDGAEHKRRRRLVQPAFHTRRIHGYFDVMLEEADAVIDELRPGATADLYADFRRAVRRSAVRSLFGDELRDRADEIGDMLQPAIDFVMRSPLRQVKVDLPGTAWRAAKRARASVDALVDEEVARRRAAGTDGGDLLDMLIAARDEGGDRLTDEELRDQVVSLIAAGYDTTSAAVGWAIHGMLADPDVLARAHEEVDRVLDGRRPHVEDVPSLRWLDGIVHEALRLQPPGFLAPRTTVADVEVAGHVVPAGTLVLYSALVTGRLPALWPDPDAFRPERWDPDAPGYVEPAPYSFVPFGGGYRRCIGFAFATLEIKAVLLRLLQRTRLSLVPQRIEPAGIGTMFPKHGVTVRVDEVRASA